MKLIHPLKEVIESGQAQKVSAALLGVSPSYLCDMINGKRKVGPKIALRVQKKFDVDAMTILTRQAACDLADELKKPKR